MTPTKACIAATQGIWQRPLSIIREALACLIVAMMAFGSLSAFAGGNAPVASSMSITVLEDLPVTIPLQATDNEGDPLTYSIVSQPDANSGVLSGTGANLTFIPVNNFNGGATFTFKVNDGTSDSEVATVYIEVLSVNDAPILNGVVVSGKEDERLSFSKSLFSAQYSDLEGDPFDSLTVTTLPKTGVLKWDGTPVFAGQIIPVNLLDQLMYDPAKDDNGVRSFTVRGSDGLSLSTLTTVTMVIAAVNDVPVLANITKSSGLLEDAVVPFAAVDFTSKYEDIEKTPLSSIRIKTVPPLGTLKLGGIGLKAGDVVLAADLNSLKFEPAAHQNGDVVFQVSASDGVNASADALVSLFITPVNDAPSGVISLSTVTVAEDSGAYNNPAFITGATSGPSNESAQSMAYSMVTSDLTLFSVPPSISDDGRLTFIPGDNKNGTATVTVAESAVADAGANGTLAFCSSDGPLALFTALGGSPQAGGTWTAPGGASFGGTYDPSADAPGVFTYTVVSPAPCPNASASVTVSVELAPNAGTSGSLALCSTASPVALFASLTGAQAGGSWTAPGGAAFSGTVDPAMDAPGLYTYTLTGTAPCVNDQSTVSVSVTASPDAGSDGSLTLCSTDAPASLFTSLSGAQAGGSWIAPGGVAFGGTYDPAVDAAGTYSYVLAGTAPCVNDQSTVTVAEVVASNAGVDLATVICDLGTPVNLFALLVGAQPGGVWTGPGGGLFQAPMILTWTHPVVMPTP